MGLKGQSAIEYTTTYGWMVIAAAVVGSTIYTVTGDADQCRSVDGFSGQFPQVRNVYTFQNDSTGYEVYNPRDDRISLKELYFSEQYSFRNQTQPLSASLRGDESGIVVSRLLRPSSACNTFNVTITYSSGGIENLTSSGVLEAPIDILTLLADFKVSDVVPDVGQEVEFNATDTIAENNVRSYSWDFDNDGNYTGSGEVVNHTYTAPGLYSPELRVRDSEGNVDIVRKVVIVGGLTKTGGTVPELEVGSTLATKCIGDECSNVTNTNEVPVDTGGDFMNGTLFTDRIVVETGCVTDYESFDTSEGCEKVREDTEGYLSDNYSLMEGSLKVPSLKPNDTNFCVGRCPN